MQLDLKRRLALSLIGLSVGLASLLAAALWLGSVWMESTMLDRVLGSEMAWFADNGAAPASPDATITGLRYYRPSKTGVALPPELAPLTPGSHQDFQIGPNRFHVLVREFSPGDRAYVLYDVNALSHRERALALVLTLGVFATGLLAWLASGWISRRALAPLEAVVARIHAIDPAQRGQRLDSWPEDGDLEVIVNAMNEHMAQLDALVSRERAFAGAASHELRTPLSAIRGAAEVLGVVPTVPRPVLERIEQSVAEAVADLDALLALSQGRELPLRQPLQLDQLLPRLAQDYEADARDNETRVVWSDVKAATIDAAPAVVGIIFTNLLRNAIRAAPDGEVKLTLDSQSFSVTDNGDGMTSAELAHAFEPGVKGKHGGSGMGLYISQTLARRCGWTLTLESLAGKGTTARLTFGAGEKPST